ncbi:MAG TPA: serine protease [Burkholderiales bacterium]|nr:serine protease [Burkholderiales bacterium]
MIPLLRFLTLCAALFAVAASAQERSGASRRDVAAEAVSENARIVLERARPSIVQIRGFFGANTAQAFHGTGFAVARGGILLTNYHVTAEQVMYPEKYRLEYRTPEGKTGGIRVLAVDVRHDLAVVRAQGFDAPPLMLNARVPDKGTRAYSIGFPLDVGLTITEGVSNGRVEDSFEPRIHYSGAINGGMSGGPAFNAAGQVIGVNVSGYRFEQLVSFLVPASHASALIEQALAQKAPPAAAQIRQQVLEQLHAHADALVKALTPSADPMPVQRIGGYALPGKLAEFIDCGASGDPAPEAPVRTERISCSAKAGLYLQQGLYTGDLRYSHFVLSTEKLGPLRFSNRLSDMAQARGGFGARRHVSPFTCRDSTVALQGFDARLMVCTRALRNFDGLYDITARVVSLNQGARGFASHLDLYGVDFAAGMAFLRRYVGAMRWEG